MSDTLEQEIRHLRALYWSDRDPEGRAFAPLADACLRAGRTDEAEELLQDGRSRLPDFLPGHLISARLHQASGNLERAEAAYRVARELDPENSEVLLGLGRILAGKGSEAGVEMVERARALDPTVGSSARPAVPAEAPAPDPEGSSGQEDSSAPESPGAGTAAGGGEPASDVRPEEVPEVTEFAPSEIEDFGSPWDTEDEAVISVSDLAPDDEEVTEAAAEEKPVEASARPEEPVSDPAAATVAELSQESASDPEEDDDDTVVTTRTLAELFVRQGLTERAIEVYERLLARNPEDDGIRVRLSELGAEAPDSSHEEEEARAGAISVAPTGTGVELPDRHVVPEPPALERSVEPTDPEDTDPHVPSAPDPHPEDPTPFGWAETDEEPREAAVSGISIATYLGRLLAFTPGLGGDGQDDDPFDAWEDRA